MGQGNIRDWRPVRCACVVGTRPEVIKMAPVIRRLNQTKWAQVVVIAMGQQDDLLERAPNDFQLRSVFPYCDGRAEQRIAAALQQHFAAPANAWLHAAG